MVLPLTHLSCEGLLVLQSRLASAPRSAKSPYSGQVDDLNNDFRSSPSSILALFALIRLSRGVTLTASLAAALTAVLPIQYRFQGLAPAEKIAWWFCQVRFYWLGKGGKTI